MTPEEMLQIMSAGTTSDADSEDSGEEFGGMDALEPLEEISGDTSEETSSD